MARAAALAAIEDLPADMRRFTETMLVEHAGHRARDQSVTRLIRRMQLHARRWPELGWSNQDALAEETPRNQRWRTQATEMLVTARAWLAEDADLAPHLDAKPHARTGMETAVRDVERVLARNDWRIFEGRWQTVRERAARDAISVIDVEGYGDLAALGETLALAGGLDRAQRRTLDAWRSAHDAATALAERFERYPREVVALIEARHALELPSDADGDFDPEHAAYRAWRERAAGLLARGASLLEPHLPAAPERRAQVERASAALADQLHADDCRALGWRYRALIARAESAATLAFYTPGYDALAATARDLDAGRRTLAADAQAVVDALREHDETCRRQRSEIEHFPAEVRTRVTQRIDSAHLPIDALMSAHVLRHDGGSMLANARDYGPHLDAMPGARNRIAAALASLHRALDADPHRTSSAEAYVIPCPDRVVTGDRIRWTMPPEADHRRRITDEMPQLDCTVLAVEPARRSDDDLVQLRVEAREGARGPAAGEVLWTSMMTLSGPGCLRSAWADEDRRARIETRARRAALERARIRELRRSRSKGRGMSF